MVSKKDLTQPSVGILSGPTASGKSGLALDMIREFNRDVEIISADSIQVYTEADIGSAKPSRQELEEIPHHLIGILGPSEDYTAGSFRKNVNRTLEEIHKLGKRALIVGGTGFYLKALIYNMWTDETHNPELREELENLENQELRSRLAKIDPESAYRISENDRYRLIRALEVYIQTGKTPTNLRETKPSDPDPRFELWIIDREREELQNRIRWRARQMIQQGLVAEVENLRTKYPGTKILGSVGYAQVCDFLDGKKPKGRELKPGLPGLEDEIFLATRQLVKKQRTWFRGEPAAIHFKMDDDIEKLKDRFKNIYA